MWHPLQPWKAAPKKGMLHHHRSITILRLSARTLSVSLKWIKVACHHRLKNQILLVWVHSYVSKIFDMNLAVRGMNSDSYRNQRGALISSHCCDNAQNRRSFWSRRVVLHAAHGWLNTRSDRIWSFPHCRSLWEECSMCFFLENENLAGTPSDALLRRNQDCVCCVCSAFVAQCCTRILCFDSCWSLLAA